MARKSAVEADSGFDQDQFDKQVMELREAGKTWQEISDVVGVGQGRCMLSELRNEWKDNPIKYRNESELATKIVKARQDEKQSWGVICARTGLPESRLRSIYEEQSGTPAKGDRVGKGGRFPAGGAPAAPGEKAPRAKKATKAKAEPVEDTAPKGKMLVDMSVEELQGRLNGKVITVQRGGNRQEKMAVSTITTLKAGEMSFSDKDGKQRVIKVTEIKKATR